MSEGRSRKDSLKRLSPEMACFRGLVLVFVREYLETYSISPSQGEIVNGVHGATRQRVRVMHASQFFE